MVVAERALVAGAGSPLLVPGHSIIQQGTAEVDGLPEIKRKNPCQDWRYSLGECEAHGTKRWAARRCKRRDCPGCSAVRRWELASRIAYGVRILGPGNCAFLVLTYADAESADPAFKARAVALESDYIRWLRKVQAQLGNPHVHFAKTWEIQPHSKRLHTNLVVGPWVYVPQSVLRRRWGAHLSVSRIVDDETISREATKARSPAGLAGYLTKLEQTVPAAWRRAVSFSRHWPKEPEPSCGERVGVVTWTPEHSILRDTPGTLPQFLGELAMGWWMESVEGSGEYVSLMFPEPCDCFGFQEPERAAPAFAELCPVPGVPLEDASFESLTLCQRRALEDLLN